MDCGVIGKAGFNCDMREHSWQFEDSIASVVSETSAAHFRRRNSKASENDEVSWRVLLKRKIMLSMIFLWSSGKIEMTRECEICVNDNSLYKLS
jgi:hypothetical protein